MSALLRFNGTPTVQQLTPTLPAESEAVATIRPLLHPAAVATGEFRHDSRRVVTSCWMGTVPVWDVSTGSTTLTATNWTFRSNTEKTCVTGGRSRFSHSPPGARSLPG